MNFELVKVNLMSLFAQMIQVGSFPTMIPIVLSAAGVSKASVGVITSLPWLVVLFGAPLASRIINRVGTKNAALVGLVISLAGLVLAAVSSGNVVWIGLSALAMGAGLTLRWVACDTWIVQLAGDGTRGRAIGIHESLMGFGIALGPFIILLGAGNVTLYWIFSITLLIGAVAVLLFTGRTVPIKLPNEVSVGAMEISRFSVLLAGMYITVFGAMLSDYVEISVVSFLPLFLTENSFSAEVSLLYLSAFGLGGTLLQFPLGYLADRFGLTKIQIISVLLVIFGAVFGARYVGYAVTDMLVMFFWGGVVGGLNTLAVIHAGSSSAEVNLSKNMAIIASAYTLGSVFGPFVSGLVWGDGSGGRIMVVFVLLSVLYLAGILISLGREKAWMRVN